MKRTYYWIKICYAGHRWLLVMMVLFFWECWCQDQASMTATTSSLVVNQTMQLLLTLDNVDVSISMCRRCCTKDSFSAKLLVYLNNKIFLLLLRWKKLWDRRRCYCKGASVVKRYQFFTRLTHHSLARGSKIMVTRLISYFPRSFFFFSKFSWQVDVFSLRHCCRRQEGERFCTRPGEGQTTSSSSLTCHDWGGRW